VKTDVATLLQSVQDKSGSTTSSDPVLAALAHAHARRMRAEEEIRLLLAYARRFVYPHPYTYGELAGAAGISVSGARTAYGPHDVEKVADATGLEPVAADSEDV
jgi:hypothetical protein